MGIWAIVYFSLKNRESKKEMLIVSIWTSLLGLTEPFFVPEYWNPPSLFNLAQTTGFDIESLIFAFSIGGLAVSIYEKFFVIRHEAILPPQTHNKRHILHLGAIISFFIVFWTLFSLTNLNPIYSAIVSLFVGGFFTLLCRPDLKNKMVASAFIFAGVYFLYFLTLVIVFPVYVEKVWNLAALSGVLILGVPLEEILFALGVGFLWSSVYEHIKWYTIKQENK